jgi:hypothetical protein
VSHLGGLVVVGIVEDFELDDDFEVVNVVLDDDGFELEVEDETAELEVEVVLKLLLEDDWVELEL